MHNLGCTLYIVVRFLWFFHYISLLSETLFFNFFLFLTKISYVIDVDCFQLSLIIWTFSTGLWCDSGSSSSQMNPKQQRWSRHLNTNQRRVPKRAHSREEVIVKFLVWLADLVVVVILCWFFVFGMLLQRITCLLNVFCVQSKLFTSMW